MEDKNNCVKWAKAMQTKCQANSKCKIAFKTSNGKCQGQFKSLLSALWKTTEDAPLFTNSGVGSCFTSTLNQA